MYSVQRRLADLRVGKDTTRIAKDLYATYGYIEAVRMVVYSGLSVESKGKLASSLAAVKERKELLAWNRGKVLVD